MTRSFMQSLPQYQSSISDDEFIQLQKLAFQKHVLEIGSFKGYSAYRMAFSANRVDCVDSFEECIVQDFIQNTSMYDNIFLHVGRSEDVVPLFLPIFDMVFIDGDHTYDAVLVDLNLAYDKVKYGGVIVVHDYYDQPDVDYLGRKVEVKRALDDWLEANLTMPMRTLQDIRGFQQGIEPPPAKYENKVPMLDFVDSMVWFTVNWR